jgi:RNA polymerase sigma-70 factor (sigma-E family)
VATDVEGYRAYVTARMPALRRVAFLLCGDWHTADDVLSAALVRLLLHWPRASAADNVDGYVRRILVRTMLNERRRPWRREHALGVLPEPAPQAGDSDAVDERISLLTLLDELPARRRAVVVLRYCCDLSVEETARELGCSTGTVKSQAARALDTLRQRMTVEEESPWSS